MDELKLLKNIHLGKKSYANDRRKLNRKLKKAGINFIWRHSFDGYQWLFPEFRGDAIIHSFSYGNKQGYFETYGMPWDNGDVSMVSAKDLIKHLKGEMIND